MLDVGCGQGRDALFIARLGHCVTAVDFSPTAIRQLREDAGEEGLKIDATVADVRDYEPPQKYDVIVIDRTLHMLGAKERLNVLRRLLSSTVAGGAVLIADERSNIPAFQRVLDESGNSWSEILKKRGYLFVRRGQ